jgi:hypothetical protein
MTVVVPGVDGGTPDDGKAKLARALEEEEIRDQERKTLLINDAMRIINPMKPTLREALDLQVTNAKGETKQYQAKDGQLAETGDTTTIRSTDTISKGGTKPPKKKGKGGQDTPPDPGKIIDEARKGYDVIVRIQQRLEAETVTHSRLDTNTGNLFQGPAEKLFTTTEIMDELYTPLIRERILPDTFVIGKFSKVQQMLDATNEFYKEELKKVEDPGSGVAALAKSMVQFGSDMAGPILQMAGVDTSLAKTLLEGATALAEVSIDLGDKIHSGLSADSIKEFLSGLPSIIGSLVGTATGDSDLGTAVTNAGNAGAAGINMIITSVKAKKPDSAGLITFFSAVLTTGLGEVSTGSNTGDALVTLGNDMQSLISGAASSHSQDFFDAVSRGDSAGARAACKAMCIDIASGLPSLGSDVWGVAGGGVSQPNMSGNGGSEKPIDDTVQTIQDTVGDVQQIISSNKDASEELKKKLEKEAEGKFEGLAEKVDKDEKKREEAKKDPEKFAAAVQKELEDEKKAFVDQLNGLNDPTTDQKTVMKLIAKIQKDRAILSVAVAIGKGGIDVASHFFGPLAMATEAIKMSLNIAAAVERAVYLRKFVDEKIGASNATSPYMTSIENFVENQANQLTHYAIAAALNGVKIAAAAAATAYPAAAPAVPIASAIQAGAEALYQFYNANQVRKAWNVTKEALSNPENRALGLKARKVNPTLAKYAIAYGATVDRDPIAVSMANACGLDNETLKNKDTNVAKVKMFLEIKFKDDNKVVGHWEDPAKWTAQLPEVEVNAAAVFKTYKVITDNLSKSPAYIEVLGGAKAVPPNDLIGLIRALEKQTVPEPPTSEILTERLSLIGRVVGGFNAERVKLGPIHEDVDAILEAFADAADLQQEKLVMALLKLKVEDAKKSKETV